MLGTRVQGKALKGGAHQIVAGDRLEVGELSVVFEVGGPWVQRGVEPVSRHEPHTIEGRQEGPELLDPRCMRVSRPRNHFRSKLVADLHPDRRPGAAEVQETCAHSLDLSEERIVFGACLAYRVRLAAQPDGAPPPPLGAFG